MSNELHDLFKRELNQIPLRPATTWVPTERVLRRSSRAWRVTLGVSAAVLLVVGALVGGRQLASLRERGAAAPGTVAGKALYLSPSFNGSGWILIDPLTLADLSAKPLLGIAPTSTSSSDTQISPDGSTIIVSDYGPGTAVHRSVYDARTGQLRGYFVPQVPMVADHLSAAGDMAMGRLGTNSNALSDAKVIVSVDDGHVVRTVPPGPVGEIQAAPAARDLSAIYYFTTPAPLDLLSDVPRSLPYSLVVQSTVTGALSAPIPLTGISAGTVYAGSGGPGAMPLTVRPGIAMSVDGTRLVALSHEGTTLDLVDTRTLAVTTQTVRRKTSLLDWLRPLNVQAKTVNDEESWGIAFTPDGTALLAYAGDVHYDTNGPVRSTRSIQRIDVATGLITAESMAPEGIYGFAVSPDGTSLYVIVGTNETPRKYALRRLDAETLECKAERALPDYAELKIVAAPIAGVTARSRTYCSRARLEYLAESFFTSYNAHDLDGVLALFNWNAPATGAGFGSYIDNPTIGGPHDLRDQAALATYLRDRFALDDRFTGHAVQYPPSPYISDRGNPTATFTRSFSGLSQQGFMQLDCNADLLVHVRMTSQ